MRSRSPVQPRRAPQQERGERRVEALLDAAAAELAASGYDAATMSAIAERAGSSIGSLYQFFPNKLSIADALCERYSSEVGELWARAGIDAGGMPLEKLAERLVRLTLRFIDSHPALLRLVDAPKSMRSQEPITSILIGRLESLLLAYRPHLAKRKARNIARVTLTIMKAFHFLYLESAPKERRWVAQEYKAVLFCYWNSRLEEVKR